MKNIHVFSTDIPSRLYGKDGNYKLDNSTIAMDWYISSAGYKSQHIYITNDEEIKKGDWVIQINFEKTNTQLVHCLADFQVRIANNKDGSFTKDKIILTTDQDLIKEGVQEIDNEFIEWFIQNPSCNMVEISTYHVKGDISGKLHYKITIPQKEPKDFAEWLDKGLSEGKQILEELKAINAKQETLEQAAKRYKDLWLPDDHYDAFIAGAKWQAEKMYSEDDVRRAIYDAYYMGSMGEPIDDQDANNIIQYVKNK